MPPDPAQEPRQSSSLPNEVEGLSALAEALEPHDERTQRRMLEWAWDRYVTQYERDREALAAEKEPLDA